MKHIVAIILCFSFILGLSGCSLSSDNGENQKGTGNDGKTVADAQTKEVANKTGSDAADNTGNQEARDETLSFVGCGDNIIYYGNVREAAAQSNGQGYDFSPTYQNVREMISGADISFVNQETLMCGNGYELSYYPKFNGPQAVGDALCDTGFDVINIANNHMLDMDAAGLAATIGYWETKPVLLIGGYRSQTDCQTPRILEKSGLKIAFLSYTYATNGLTCAEGSGVYVPYLAECDVTADVKNARALADLVFVSVHWGEENSFAISEQQLHYSQLLTNAGADVILGHHPHVIQPVQWLEGTDGHRTLCVYSLGNFIGEMSHDYNMVGGMISFDIHAKGKTISIENPIFTPTVYHFSTSFYQNQVYLMKDYTESLAAAHGVAYYGNTTSLSRLHQYVTDTIDPVFLPAEWQS